MLNLQIGMTGFVVFAIGVGIGAATVGWDIAQRVAQVICALGVIAMFGAMLVAIWTM